MSSCLNHTHVSEEFKRIMEEIGISVQEVAKAVLIGMGSLIIWLLKKLGDKHVSSITDLKDELKASRVEINVRLDRFLEMHHDLVGRVKVIESKIDHRDDTD